MLSLSFDEHSQAERPRSVVFRFGVGTCVCVFVHCVCVFSCACAGTEVEHAVT